MGDPTKLGGGTRPNTGSAATVTKGEGGSLTFKVGQTEDGRVSERGREASQLHKWDINYIIFSL